MVWPYVLVRVEVRWCVQKFNHVSIDLLNSYLNGRFSQDGNDVYCECIVFTASRTVRDSLSNLVACICTWMYHYYGMGTSAKSNRLKFLIFNWNR